MWAMLLVSAAGPPAWGGREIPAVVKEFARCMAKRVYPEIPFKLKTSAPPRPERPEAARAMLALPDCDEKNVPDDEAGRRFAGYILCDERLVVEQIRRTASTDQWELMLRGQGTTPAVATKGELPRLGQFTNPVVRVRVEGKKLAGVAVGPGLKLADGNEDERLVRRFGYLARIGDRRATAFLPDDEAIPKEPIKEEEAERLAAVRTLRLPGLQVRGTETGEPDEEGTIQPAKGRYTLDTTGSVTIQGFILAPGKKRWNFHKIHPAVVVEVKKGRLVPIRAVVSMR